MTLDCELFSFLSVILWIYFLNYVYCKYDFWVVRIWLTHKNKIHTWMAFFIFHVLRWYDVHYKYSAFSRIYMSEIWLLKLEYRRIKFCHKEKSYETLFMEYYFSAISFGFRFSFISYPYWVIFGQLKISNFEKKSRNFRKSFLVFRCSVLKRDRDRNFHLGRDRDRDWSWKFGRDRDVIGIPSCFMLFAVENYYVR